jgi:hypothetical protein
MKALRPSILLALLAASPWALAGRPLSSDDAGTADAGTCQVETWSEKAGSERAFVIAPACGVWPGLEIGADYTSPKPRDVIKAEAGLALKWVPKSWTVDTGAGDIGFGLKFSGAWAKPVDASWQSTETGMLGLATWSPSDSVTVHANVGLARERASRTQATVLNLALVWTPHDSVLFFVEGQGNNKKDTFGGTVSTVGARYWLVKDMIGLDLTASRESGAGSTTRWTVGLGWYGIGS